ncbi:MAG TPA: nuclear transport factor 2 family protein [Methylibium sp.]|jgi:uncharacterized protein (TIGR02246 family)|nr:nuclear transport factor 2 family protein [Methylibium sp.]
MPQPPKAPPSSPDDIEQQFYEALQQADVDKLMAVWADDEEIACVHPGGPRMVGAGAIRASFDAIFANGAIDVVPDKVRRLHTHSSAVHHVLERVQIASEGGTQTAFAIVTNVYVKTAQGWRMVLHHASPGMARELQEIAEAPSTLH